jgi:hypothetical protein
MEATMIDKLINAWCDSYRVAENHRVVRGNAERLVWSGREAVGARFNGRVLAPATSWL